MIVGTFTNDFADQNPELAISVYEIMNIYRSHNKEEASKIIWSAVLTAVPAYKNNPYKNTTSAEQRRELIREAYYPNYTNKYEFLEKKVNELVSDAALYLYNIHLKKYQELVAKIDDFNLDDNDQFDRYLETVSKMDKIIKIYDSLEKKYSESSKDSSVEGGGQLSVAERRRNAG